MKRILFHLLILIAPILATAQEMEWEAIPLPPNTESQQHDRVVMYESLLIFPISNGDIFAANGDQRLYRSTDAGKTWRRRGSGLYGSYARITEGPEGDLYAATETGFYHSIDRGDHWSLIHRTEGGYLQALDDGSLVGITGRGPVLLPKGAAAWTFLDTALDGRRESRSDGLYYPPSFAIDSTGAIYLLRVRQRATSILRSSDRGEHWDTLAITLGRSVPSGIQAGGGGELYIRAADSVWRSNDRGETWRPLPVRARESRSPIVISPDGRLYLDYQQSSDGGDTWMNPFVGKREKDYDRSLPAKGVAVDRAGRVYAFSIDGTLYRSKPTRSVPAHDAVIERSPYPIQRSLTWVRLTRPTWERTYGIASYTAPFPIFFIGPGGSLFAGGPRAGLHRSTDEGATWSEVWKSPGPGESERLVVSALYAGRFLYAAIGREGIFRSSDNGATWEKVVSVARPFMLLKGKGGVICGMGADSLVYSSDNGATWRVEAFPSKRGSIGPAIDSNGVIYAASKDRSDDRMHLVSSSDGGISWSDRLMPRGLGESVLLAGPRGELYALQFGGTSSGDLLSTDGGERWGEMIPSGRLFNFSSMMIGPGGSLVVGTVSSGVTEKSYLGRARVSLDGGRTWRSAAQPFGVDDLPITFAVDSLGRLYAATTGGAIYRSEGSMLDSATIEEVPYPAEGWRAPSFDSTELQRRLYYPASGREGRRGGTVTLAVLVDPQGGRSKVEVEGDDELGKIVAGAAGKVTFRPGMRDGAPQEGWVTATISFGNASRWREQEWDSTIRVRIEGTGSGLWMKPGSAVQPMTVMTSRYERSSFVSLDTEPAWDSLELQRNIRYPRAAILERAQGRLLVTALIEADGSVSDARLRRGEGKAGLDSAAIDAVMRTRFTPATLNGKPMAAWAAVPVQFTLPPAGENRRSSIDTAALRALLSYPPKERKKKISGHVEMAVRIDTNGRIDARVENGSSQFTSVVEKALRRVSAKPMLCYGIPVEDSLYLMVDFEPGEGSGRSSGEIRIYLGNGWSGNGFGVNVDVATPEMTPPAYHKELPAEPEPDEFIAVEEEPKYDQAELGRNVVYPEIARRNGIEGTVVVSALIDTDGKVRKTQIEASANNALNQAAIDAVMKTKFKPATQGGKPVKLWIRIPVKFMLSE